MHPTRTSRWAALPGLAAAGLLLLAASPAVSVAVTSSYRDTARKTLAIPW